MSLAPDYPVRATLQVTTRDELIAIVREHRGAALRIVGGGSKQDQLPAPAAEVTLLRTGSMARIDRLEADDLTCSVEPGVRHEQLDAALAERRVWLPCGGAGTIAGSFAADLDGAAGPGALAPRALLLGMEAVLPEGLAFKAGARVVKSVAGFDLPKLFVGSRGRLFAVTLLHLKLRPRPAHFELFHLAELEHDRAHALFGVLRRLPTPPVELWLERDATGSALRGAFAGSAAHVTALRKRFELRGEPMPEPVQTADEETELVRGLVPWNGVGDLLQQLPADAAVRLNGTGRVEIALRPGETDALLAAAPAIGLQAEISRGAPERRGRATPADPTVVRLDEGLKQALDPHGMLL